MQDQPVCFKCKERIDGDFVYEAPCGHDRCSSAVFHPLCLMEFRDMRSQGELFEVVAVLVMPWTKEHSEHG